MSKEMPMWMNEEEVQKIPKEKLEFLQNLFIEGHGKSRKEIMSRLLPLLKEAKKKGLTLEPEEISAAVNALKKHSSPEEIDQLNRILSRNKTGGQEGT